MEPVVVSLQNLQSNLHCKKLPSIEDIFSQPAPPYLYNYRFQDVHREAILILHSSGSTGRPKPVVMTHSTFAVYDVRDFPTVPGRVNYDISILDFPQPSSLIYEPFPLFHIAGFIYKVVVPLYTNTSPIFGPPLRPPSGPLAAQILQAQANIRCLILPPTVIEELHKDPQAIQLYRKLEIVCFAGGPLAKAVGEEIAKHTAVCQFYGSTEMGQIRQLFPHRENWAYIELHPSAKQEMQRIEGSEDLYELVVYSDETTERTSSLNHNYPGLREWHTKDIFVRHPSKPKLWKFHARTDDILVFSSGEKLYPIDFERSLMALPHISGALMVGNGRSRAGLLLEMSSDYALDENHMPKIWPAIEKANADIPTQGRVIQSMVIIASLDKPFARAAKGTIMRKQTESLYSLEINKLFEDSSTSSGLTPKSTFFDELTTLNLLRSILSQVSMDANIGKDDNLFLNGMDSIKTVELVQYLKAAISANLPDLELGWLTLDLVYVNCTLKKLSAIIQRVLNDKVLPHKEDRESIIEGFIDRYTKAVSYTEPEKVPANNGRVGDDISYSVALTGSTGYLGSNIIEKLLDNSSITRIYCLDRNPNASQKWYDTHTQTYSKLQFLTVDLRLPGLGLSDDCKQELTAHLNLVIHNAWPVNFNLPLTAFEPSFDGVLHLIELCTRGSPRPHLLFVSSITSTGMWSPLDSTQQTIPESLVYDPYAPLAMGYAQSKLVTENIIYAATSRNNLSATILRLGLICPSKKAKSTMAVSSDVVAALLQSSKSLRMIPSDFVEIDWITIDEVTSVVDELVCLTMQAETRSIDKAQFFNLTNPQPAPWANVLSKIQAWCGEGTTIVPMSEWIERVERAGKDGANVNEVPALKMLEVFKLICTEQGKKRRKLVEMKRLAAFSETVAKMEPVHPQLIHLWMNDEQTG